VSRRPSVVILVTALAASLLTFPALAAPRTTVTLTIQDTDDDRLLEHAPGENYVVLDGRRASGPPATARSSTSCSSRISR
jgi:hypothetical protein